MALFDRFKSKGDKYSDGKDAELTGWENMADPSMTRAVSQEQDYVKIADSERQKRKILGAFALGINGHINVDALNQHDVTMSREDRDSVIDWMASGQIGGAQKRELLSRIWGPMQSIDNAGNVVSTLNTKHEKRILASMGSVGFNNWQSVGAGDMRTFIERYPTPMDFQATSDSFLDDIERNNGPDKRAEYEVAMSSFKNKVYGKKQEYWDRMRELDQEVDAARDRHERERSAEWVPGDSAVWQTSKNQARAGMVNRENIDRGLWANDTCEDSYFSRPEKQIYGVFDGAGGMSGGRLASQIAAGVFREYSDRYEMKTCSSLATALEAANQRVASEPNAGITTATVASVINRNGREMLAYASVGDSRLYVVDKNGITRQITQDEGFGNKITNAVGHARADGGPIVQQFGEIDIHPGDRIVICSDGITGDYGDDLMSEEELGGIVRNSHGALDASKNLLAAARKSDDRTALVFVPDFNRL